MPGLADHIGAYIIRAKETEAAKQSEADKSGTDLALQYMNAVAATNKLKAENHTERLLVIAFLLFTLPVGVHWWAVMLDSMPFLGHAVGSWHIAAPPGEWQQTYHTIIQSFFIGAPAVAGVAALARIFRR